MPSFGVLSFLTIAAFASSGSALQHVQGGPCESVCNDSTAGNVSTDAVCLDNLYFQGSGNNFRECVSCQLNSTAVDASTGFTDVGWALFNLRWNLAECMYAYPNEIVSISSPCQVSCQPLEAAVINGISDSNNTSNATANYSFCTAGQFDDTTINNCAYCYSFIPQQIFLGNFMQALHIACRDTPISGHTFYPDGPAVFNNTRVAGPTGATPPPPKKGLTGTSLALAVALPLVGGILILVGTCFCCWKFTSRRRKRMASTGRMSMFREAAADMSNSTYSSSYGGSPPAPESKWAWNMQHEPARELEKMQGSQTITALPTPRAERFGSVGPGAGQRQDHQLHEQFMGDQGHTHEVLPEGTFRAQDGVVQDY